MKIDSNKLELAMGNACITAEKLADKTGIGTCTLTRIKKGQQNPRPATVGKIAKALNVKVEDLVE